MFPDGRTADDDYRGLVDFNRGLEEPGLLALEDEIRAHVRENSLAAQAERAGQEAGRQGRAFRDNIGPWAKSLPGRVGNFVVDEGKRLGGTIGGIIDNEIDPMSDEAIQAVFETTGLLALQAPLTGAKGAAGVFGGRLAKTADLDALSRAERMAASGADRRAIWDETGWFKGRDGQWRFEIDDSASRFDAAAADAKMPSRLDIAQDRFAEQTGLPRHRMLNGRPEDEAAKREALRWADENLGRLRDEVAGAPLSRVLPHDDLYRAYPDMAEIGTARETLNGLGGTHNNNRITYGGETLMSRPDNRSVLLHEGQHAIQAREGFARGGSPGDFSNVPTQVANDAWKDLHSVLRGDTAMKLREVQGDFRAIMEIARSDPDGYAAVSDALNKLQVTNFSAADDALAALSRKIDEVPTPMQQYRRLAGEVEARNVQTRRDFTPEQRRAQAPWETQDVPDDLQIVRMGGDGPQMSADLPMDEASRMARAREMGVTESGYHGTGADIGSFNGMTWMSDSPRLANDYAAMRGMEGGSDNVMPLMMRPGQTFEADALPRTVTVGDMVNELLEQANAAGRTFDEPRVKEILDNVRAAAKRQESGPHYGRHDFWNNSEMMFGRDGAKALRDLFDELGFNSVRMTEGGERTIGVFNPADVRSRFAKFDPAKRGSSDILASMAPIGLGTVGALPLLTSRDD
jgi:hypothetical protein